MVFTQKDIDRFLESYTAMVNCFDSKVRFKIRDFPAYSKCHKLFDKFLEEFQEGIEKEEAKLNSLKGKRTVMHKPAARKPARK